jgi:molybdopterin-guanine dinucleotide biosynthesis protein A
MGSDKALLKLGGQPLVWRTVERLRPVVVEVVLVGAPERYGHLGLPVLADREAGRGPLAGLVTALAATEYDWNLVIACDLPYLEMRFLEFLLDQAKAEAADAVIPFTHGKWQPLCAAYHRRCLAAFERVLTEGSSKVALAFEQIRVRALTLEELHRFAFEERILKNMNTPEDYAEAQRLLGGQAGG